MAFAFSVLFTPPAAEAQQKVRLPRIGYLGTSSASLEPELVKAFQKGLRDLGYVEGQNIAIEYRWAEGNDHRLPDLVAELVRLKVDLILTAGTPGAFAAKRSNPDDPYRHGGLRGCGWSWACLQPCPARREPHRIDRDGPGPGRETPGASQGGLPNADYGRRSSEHRQPLQHLSFGNRPRSVLGRWA